MKKTVRRARMILLFAGVLACISLNAEAGLQQERFDCDYGEVSLVRFFEKMQEHMKRRFVFNHEDVEGYTVNAVVKNKTVSEILEMVLKDKPLKYEISDEHIIIASVVAPQNPRTPGIRVSGTVRDADGEVLAGVSVFVKGSSIGVITDEKGEFSLSVPRSKDVILVFSFVGMKTREIRLKPDKFVYNIRMENQGNALEDVVVTGLGNRAKSSFTGAAQIITKDQLLSMGSVNVLQSLQAFVSGMQLVENTEKGSDPNTRPEILIRGRSSFTSGTNIPTFIVDGAEVSLDYIFDMDINDVEFVTVLKDASASALYGAKAANGVVVVTTRSMKAGELKLSYSLSYKTSFPDLSDYRLLNASEKLEYERLAKLYTSPYGPGEHQYELDGKYHEVYRRVREGVNTDWLSKPLRNSFGSNNNLVAYGGYNNIRYAMNLRYGNAKGVMKGSERKRYALGFKFSYNKNDLIFIQNQISLTFVNTHESPYGNFAGFVEQNPYDRAYNKDGSLNTQLSYDHKNPLYEASLGSYEKGEDLYIYDVLDMKLRIFEGLRLETSFSVSGNKTDTEKFLSPLSKDFDRTPVGEKGSITVTHKNRIDYQGKLMLTYNKMFGTGTLLSMIAGGNIQSFSTERNGYTGIGIFSDKLTHPAFSSQYPAGKKPTGSEDIERMAGGFINVNAIYGDRYFLDISIRYEGASKFGSERRYAPFWSLGGGWNIHKEGFLNDSSSDRLKLRGSVGYLGNATFSPYQAVTTYIYESDLFYGKGIGAVPITIGNPDLKWERTLNYNIGMDVNLFDNRLDMRVDYYKKITDNLLLSVTKAPSVGVSEAIENMGKIDNSGVEVSARLVPLRTSKWNWVISLIASHNKNRIRKISNALKNQNEKNNAEKSRIPKPVFVEGESISAVKVVKSGGIDPATGREIYIDLLGNPTFFYDYRDKRVYGDSDPELYGTIGSYLNYNGWALNLMFDYRLGATVYNRTLVSRVEGSDPRNNADRRVFDSRWKKTGDYVKYKDISDKTIPEQTSRFIQDEYALGLRVLSLSYDFAPYICRKFRLSRLRMEILVNDVLRFSTIKQERGFAYPFARSFEFSLSTTF